jgi:hypothetical protein
VGWGLNDLGQATAPPGTQGSFALSAGKNHSVALAAPIPPITLTAALLTNAHIRLQFTNSANLTISIQSSTNLTNWNIIGTAVNHGDGLYDFEDTINTGIKARYYRTAF